MNKVAISQNFVMPTFQTVNKNQQSTQLILMDPQNGNLYLLHQYYCTDSDDYGELIALLQTQASQGTQSPYVLNPVVYLPIKYTNQEFQTSHFVQVLYQYGSHTLEQQLYLRIREKNFFEEHEIWSILGSCVLGLKNLKDKQFNHSSICMNDIFVTKEGQIKISHPMFRTYDHLYSQQVEEGYFERALNENYFFAPQQLPAQKQHGSQGHSINQPMTQLSTQDLFKSDIFSLGMTIISLSLLHPVNDCYIKKGIRNLARIKIESSILGQYFNALEQVMSHDLIRVLFSMVSYHVDERISIDELALMIEQMIEAKQEEEDVIQGSFNQEDGMYQYQEDAKGSVIRKQQISEQLYESEERFGKFSRVSQASPLSGRKTNRSQNMAYGTKLQQCNPDQEDKSSVVSIQCENDYQSIDICPTQDENPSLNESQTSIANPMNGSFCQLTSNNLPSFTSDPTQSVAINQTLRQYISHQQESIISQVNQTKTYQEYQQKAKQKKGFSPQEVVSVMTSKELCSLPSDSVSFVVEKHVVGGNGHDNADYNSIQNTPKTTTNTRTKLNRFLNSIKQQNSQSPSQQNHHPTHTRANSTANYVTSARTYQQQTKENYLNEGNVGNYCNGQKVYYEKSNGGYGHEENRWNLNGKEIVLQNAREKNLQSSMKSSLSISLNKDYQKLLEKQKDNPSNLYTDPKFLEAIREDVNKILKKRKIKVTSNFTNLQNSQNSMFHQMNANQVFINGRKVENLKPQPLVYTNDFNYEYKVNTNMTHFR